MLSAVFAQNTLTWTGGGTTDSWSDINNWGGVGIPDATNNILIFAGNTRLTPNNDIAGLTIRQIQFAAGAGSFTISGNDFTLGDAAGPTTTMQFYGSQLFTINNNITLGISQSWRDPDSSQNNIHFYGAINFGVNNLTLGGGGDLFNISFYGDINGTGNLYSYQFSNLGLYGNTTTLTAINTDILNGWILMGNNTVNGNITTTNFGNRLWQISGTTTVNGNVTTNASIQNDNTGFRVQRHLEVNGNVIVNTEHYFDMPNLIDDFSGGVAGTHWGLVDVNGGDLTYGANADFRLSFSGVTNPNSGNPFWNSTRRWLVGELDTGNLTYEGIPLTAGTWTNGYFFLDNIGNDLYLNWQLTPEPSTWAMLGVGGAVLAASLHRRSRR
jgi:hypothetical protein